MMKKLAVLVATLFWTINGYAAIDEKEYAKCAVNGDLSRLVCFDNLAKEKNSMGSKLNQPL